MGSGVASEHARSFAVDREDAEPLQLRACEERVADLPAGDLGDEHHRVGVVAVRQLEHVAERGQGRERTNATGGH